MITSLRIQNHRIIREAACANVPPIMMICGPNGVGKTTILDAIGRRSGLTLDTEPTIINVAPSTRVWRRERVQSRWLYGNRMESKDVYGLTSQLAGIAQMFNRQVFQGHRDLWSDDDSNQLVKPLIAKLDTLWAQHVTDEIKQANFATTAREWANPHNALADFTSQLFDEITYVDTRESGEDTQILFHSINRPDAPTFDIDELSSGEKALFSVFLPVIEEDFLRALGRPRRSVVLLVDELESHLHPALQLRVLDYMRKKVLDGYQFICTTHSTVLIKASAQKELFHVIPKGTTAGNQLRRAATEVHSLSEVMLEAVLFASGYQRHILCEGFDATKPDENNVCDSELLSALLDLDARHMVIAAGSRASLETGLRAASSAVFAPVSLASVVDGDGLELAGPPMPWCAVRLPVYSIESILLEPQAIRAALARYPELQARVERAVASATQRVLTERKAQLVRVDQVLRTKGGIDASSALTALKAGSVTDVFEIIPTSIEQLEAEWRKVRDAASSGGVALKVLKGKKIYHYLFEELGLHGYSFTHRSFADQVARSVRNTDSVPWLPKVESIVKRGLGVALGQLLVTPLGDAIHQHPHYSAIFERARNCVDRVELEGVPYAVLRENIRPEDFGSTLSELAGAIASVLPMYVWK